MSTSERKNFIFRIFNKDVQTAVEWDAYMLIPFHCGAESTISRIDSPAAAVGCLAALAEAGKIKDPEAVRSHIHIQATVTDDLHASLGVYSEPAKSVNNQLGWIHLQAAYIDVSPPEWTDFLPGHLKQPLAPSQFCEGGHCHHSSW